MNILKVNNHTIHFQLLHTTIKTNIPYNWPAFLAASCFNGGYKSSYALIRT